MLVCKLQTLAHKMSCFVHSITLMHARHNKRGMLHITDDITSCFSSHGQINMDTSYIKHNIRICSFWLTEQCPHGHNDLVFHYNTGSYIRKRVHVVCRIVGPCDEVLCHMLLCFGLHYFRCQNVVGKASCSL